MKNTKSCFGSIFLMAAALAFSSGCAAFRGSTTDVDVNQTKHMGASCDYSDMRNVTQGVVDEILASPFLSGQAAPAPIMMVAGVQNRTSRYVDTKGLTDRMRTELIRSGSLPTPTG